MEFKGTKGKWSDMSEDNHGIDIVLDNETVISMDRQSRYSGKYVMEREEMKANAKLISKAPEMLEMLKDTLIRINEAFDGEPELLKSLGLDDDFIVKIENIIKEATKTK